MFYLLSNSTGYHNNTHLAIDSKTYKHEEEQNREELCHRHVGESLWVDHKHQARTCNRVYYLL